MDKGEKERIGNLQVMKLDSMVAWVCTCCKMAFGRTVAVIVGIRQRTGEHVVLGVPQSSHCCRTRSELPLMFETIESARDTLLAIRNGFPSIWIDPHDMSAVREQAEPVH